jgi:hypothetical protein
VDLPDGLNWMMRPVDMGYCTMGDLRNRVLDLEDVALMNDSIEVRFENEKRMKKALARGR